MQYRTPNANLDSGCQTVYIATGYNWLTGGEIKLGYVGHPITLCR